MRYLIATDKYKGALTADEAAAIVADVIREIDSTAEVEEAPLTDGGEGFAAILGRVLGGAIHTVPVTGPRFGKVQGRFALLEGSRLPEAARLRLQLPEAALAGPIAFVEMASASGYESLSEAERNPWKATTRGTGELMQAAVEAGARALVLGIGGSATNDCGAGALEALGVCYYDRELQPVINLTPESFKQVATLGSTSHLIDRFPPVRIACDVANPLLGPEGATRVYGPQKGLLGEDFERMERTLHKMATRILGLYGRSPTEWDPLLAEPGSGAAGGIGFALRHALPDARFVEGFPLVADLLDLPSRIRGADCIITGEGRLDESSLAGKGPVSLVRLAEAPKQVLMLAGSVEEAVADRLQTAHPHLRVLVLSDPGWPLEEALRRTPQSLREKTAKALG